MTIRAAFDLTDEEWDQAVKLRAMSDAERELLFQRLQPQKPAAKKSSKKAGKKSARAAGMAAAISNSLQRGRGVVAGDDGEHCIYEIDDNGGLMECGEAADHNSHHKRTDPNYHPFTPAAQSAESPSDQASSDPSGEALDAMRAASGE